LEEARCGRLSAKAEPTRSRFEQNPFAGTTTVKVVWIATISKFTTDTGKGKGSETQTSAFSETMLAKELSKVDASPNHYTFGRGLKCMKRGAPLMAGPLWLAPYGWPLMAGPSWLAPHGWPLTSQSLPTLIRTMPWADFSRTSHRAAQPSPAPVR
jgi:hypothetical protein